MRALVLLVACSSSKPAPLPTTPCGKAIAFVGGAMEATIPQPDAEAFHMTMEMLPRENCAGVPELAGDWEAYLKAPDPARKRELLGRLEELAAQHEWIPSGQILRAIQAAKSP